MKEKGRKGGRLRTQDEAKLEMKTGRGVVGRGRQLRKSNDSEGECKGRRKERQAVRQEGRKTSEGQCWATIDHKEEYLAQNATPFYVDEKKNANRIYVSQFPPNWHLSLFHTLTQTHSVIPHVGTDTHSLRGGIGLVNLPIISSHRCN